MASISTPPDWDVKITIYGLISRLFIKSLREKVRRGMKGAAGRGTCTGKPPLGRTRCVYRDSEGRIVHRQDGTPRHTTCVDPETRGFVTEAFERYAIKLQSRDKIARDWNVRKVDGSTGWTPSAIRKILSNPAYVGVFIWNKTRMEFDWEEQEWVKLQNPRSEWVIRIDRSQAIILPTLWKLAQRRLAATRRANPLTGKPWSRNQRSATTLFSGCVACVHRSMRRRAHFVSAKTVVYCRSQKRFEFLRNDPWVPRFARPPKSVQSEPLPHDKTPLRAFLGARSETELRRRSVSSDAVMPCAAVRRRPRGASCRFPHPAQVGRHSNPRCRIS
jgi:hypothetical protein